MFCLVIYLNDGEKDEANCVSVNIYLKKSPPARTCLVFRVIKYMYWEETP